LKWIISAGALIGALVAIVTGVPTLVGAIPFVPLRTYDLDHLDTLDFEILQLQALVSSDQAQAYQNNDTFSAIGHLNSEIAWRQTEADALRCRVRGEERC
jgi:hypothetical protein